MQKLSQDDLSIIELYPLQNQSSKQKYQSCFNHMNYLQNFLLLIIACITTISLINILNIYGSYQQLQTQLQQPTITSHQKDNQPKKQGFQYYQNQPQIHSTIQKINTQLLKINEQLTKSIQKHELQNLNIQKKILTPNKQIQTLNTFIKNTGNSKQKKLPFIKQFSQTPHTLQFHPTFKWYHRNHAHYLLNQNVKTVLQLNCIDSCTQNYKNDSDYLQLNVIFYDQKLNTSENTTYDWVIIRYNTNKSKQAFYLAQQFTPKTMKGVTLIFNNLKQYQQFNSCYRQMLLQLMNFHKLQYDEMISLNLRRRQGKVLLIFSTQVKRSTFPYKKPIKNQIAIQLQIKFNQNIPYLREWLGYHIFLGIDKFFIYDNNGTLGQTVDKKRKSNTTTNKYGLSFSCLNYTDDYIIKQWQDIWQQFYQHIIYIPWQYLDNNSQISYAQMEGMADYINNFQDTTAYVGFIDADQILFSENKLNFSEFLTQKSLQGYSSIRLRQKKYISRFCGHNTRVLHLNQTFEVNTIGWAQKLFFETRQFYPGPSPHSGRIFNGKQFIVNNDKDWRFNHYNLIEGMIRWSQNGRNSTATKLTYDNSGKRYDKILDQICQNKCSQHFSVTCQLKDQRFSCPIDGKDYPIRKKKN